MYVSPRVGFVLSRVRVGRGVGVMWLQFLKVSFIFLFTWGVLVLYLETFDIDFGVIGRGFTFS